MMLVIFDDRIKSFFPLTQLRATGDLRCGIMKLRQRLDLLFSNDNPVHYLLPEYLRPLYQERHPDWDEYASHIGDYLYINSRLIVNEDTIREIRKLKTSKALINNGDIVALRSADHITDLSQYIVEHKKSYTSKQTDIGLYYNPAELIHDNDRLIRFDFDLIFSDKDNYFETEPGVTVLHPYNVWLGENVVLKPGVVLDASNGPIVIDDGALVMANAVVLGPCYIGKGTMIKIGAKIYQSCSIGPVCKVGGELEGTILQAYSNKQHDGFLGHSYIGEWVNIGADTNNSDLKNTYKPVELYSYETGQKYNSGTQFMGCLIGDHVKLGINSTVNTGSVIGTGSNLWGRDLINGFIPDFSWGQADSLSLYQYDKFHDTARTVKQRRALDISPAEDSLLKKIHEDRTEN